MTTTGQQVNNGRVSADTFLTEERRPQTNHAEEAHQETTVDSAVDTAPPSEEPKPIPTMGFPGFLYKVSGGKWIVPLSAKEKAANELAAAEAAAKAQAEAEAAAAQAAAEADSQRRAQEQADRDEYQNRLEDELVLVNQQVKWAALTSNVKGGAGKTPVACNLSTVHGGVTRRATTVVDNNPNWGTTAMILGIERDETISVRQMHANLRADKIGSFTDFSAPLGSNRFSVQLIASDAISRRDTYGYTVAKEVISAARQNSIYVIVDTGNEISDGAMKATLEQCDVLIVPTLTTRAKLEGAVHTMENYRDWGYGDMVKHAVVVVNGLHPGDSAENYRKKLGLNPDQIVIGIPFDKRIEDDQTVDLRLMPQATYIAYLELAVAVSKVAKYVATHGAQSAPLTIKQGEMVRLPSGRTPVLPYISSIQSAT